jgi:hypothetical protein
LKHPQSPALRINWILLRNVQQKLRFVKSWILLRNIHKAQLCKKLDFAPQNSAKLRFTINWILLRNIHQSSALRIKSTKKRSSKLGVFSHDFIHS